MTPDYAVKYRVRQERHWWFRARRCIIKRALDGLVLPFDANIAEVGCGPGGNLHLLSSFGHLSACEMDPQLREEAASLGVAEVLPGSLPDHLPWHKSVFDCVGLFDVLEHVEADLEALVALRRITRPGGTLALTVPAFNFLWSPHDDANRHFRRYTRKSLSRVLQDSGWKIELLSYFNSFLFPLAAVEKISSRWRGKETEDTMPVPKRILNEPLFHIMAAEAPLIQWPGLPVGSSLLGLATNTQ